MNTPPRSAPRPAAPAAALAAGLGLALLAACGPAPAEGPWRHGEIVEALRPTDTSAPLLWRYNPGDLVQSYASPGGGFRVHYTLDGIHGVSSIDQDQDGVPDAVALVADTYDEIEAFFAAQGLRAPLSDLDLPLPNGGDGRFDVYLLDFGFQSDGALQLDACLDTSERQCVGYIVQENDFAGYPYPSYRDAVRIISSHEYVHAIQAAYDRGQGPVFDEGMAVWGSEAFDPSQHDLERFSEGYLSRLDRSLDVPPPGPVQAFSYGTGVFFQFVSERFSPALLWQLIAHTEVGQGLPGGSDSPADPAWLSQLDLLLRAEAQSSFSEAFVEFGRGLYFTGPHADPARGLAEGAALAEPLSAQMTLPFDSGALRVFHAAIKRWEVTTPGPLYVAVADATPDDGVDDLAELTLLAAGRSPSGEVGALVERSGAALSEAQAIDPAGHSALLLSLINARASGGSARAVLCAGDQAQVEACLAPFLPPPAEPPPSEPPAETGCACAAQGGGPESLSWLALALLGLGRKRYYL